MQFGRRAPQIQATSAPVTGRLIGEVTMTASPTIPAGWLVCDGTNVSRITYSLLFNSIGTTWGSGDGSTTFTLPNLLGRCPIGAWGTNPIAAYGGEVNHTLSNAEMPNHSHTGSVGTESAWHQHAASMGHNNVVYYPGSTQSAPAGTAWPVTGIGGAGDITLGNQNALHVHGIPADGSSGAHNNMQPYTPVNIIIYAGA